MVDFGSGPGRSLFVTGGVAALRRGLQKDENAGLGRKMPFPDGHSLKGDDFDLCPPIQPLGIQPDFDQPVGFYHGIDKS
jgi:hypothetical protein